MVLIRCLLSLLQQLQLLLLLLLCLSAPFRFKDAAKCPLPETGGRDPQPAQPHPPF